MLSFSHFFYLYKQQYALKEINLEIPTNSFIAIVGPNGAGKSTFLKIIIGHLKASKGCFNYDQKLSISYLPQQHYLDRNFPLSVSDVIAMGLWSEIKSLKGLNSDQQDRLNNAIEIVGLRGYENYGLNSLSGGQFQRVLFARLILQDAQVLLLDEPFSGVDEATTNDLLHLMKKWHDEGKTVLAVMHNISLVRHFFPVTLILGKEVVAYGPTKEILTQDNLLQAHFLMGRG